MRKLIQGIVDFRREVRPGYRETFAQLALGQQPDCLFIACSDSRVVPNLFASTEPGDLFVARNVGNLVPPAGPDGLSSGDEAEAAAIEYAVSTLQVRDIVICGHSSCGAIRAVLDGVAGAPNLERWLRHAHPALAQLQAGRALDPALPLHDTLSQLNVLAQMEHVASYPGVVERVQAGALGIHGWWFDIARAEVLTYETDCDRFVVIDEAQAQRMLERAPA